jgi:hypothetical protein
MKKKWRLVCREYIFLLTSGQLEEARWDLKLRATQHRLSCRRCRAFTRNDEALERILGEHKARTETLTQLVKDEPPDAV